MREARLPDDADELAHVYVSSARHHAGLDPGFYRVPDAAAVADRYRRTIGVMEDCLLVAEADGRIVGSVWVRMMPPPSDASMMWPIASATLDVAVLDGYRGRGIGTTLMEGAERWAHEHGAQRVQFDAAAANEGALRWYRRRLGYRPFGVLLEKALGA
ncbi:MAG: GNAT family N-acetyltransferase [Streptosporangiaceae bacterium]